MIASLVPSPRVAALSPKPSQNRPEPSGAKVSQKDTSVKSSIRDAEENDALEGIRKASGTVENGEVKYSIKDTFSEQVDAIGDGTFDKANTHVYVSGSTAGHYC